MTNVIGKLLEWIVDVVSLFCDLTAVAMERFWVLIVIPVFTFGQNTFIVYEMTFFFNFHAISGPTKTTMTTKLETEEKHHK